MTSLRPRQPIRPRRRSVRRRSEGSSSLTTRRISYANDFEHKELLGLAVYAAKFLNPDLTKEEQRDLYYYKFENYLRQIFFNSDTSVALLSGAPSDDPSRWFLANTQIHEAVTKVNDYTGSTRMLGHAVVTPGQPGWNDKVDQVLAEHPPSSWKLYTIGDPFSVKTKYPFWLDDEKLMYPFYEKIDRAGIRTLCIHKGLMPADYRRSWTGLWQFQTPRDLLKAAKDWPQLNFVIYHGCLRPLLEDPAAHLAKFERSGEIPWASDLARVPESTGTTNVYAEVGASFAMSTANPRFAAALLGTWIKGLGASNVVWGTDSVFFGSPQWQIEALRRLEIPEDMQKKHRFAPLGPADGSVKNQIFGLNSARLYDFDLQAEYRSLSQDKFAQLKGEYRQAGSLDALRDNAAYGYIAKRTRPLQSIIRSI